MISDSLIDVGSSWIHEAELQAAFDSLRCICRWRSTLAFPKACCTCCTCPRCKAGKTRMQKQQPKSWQLALDPSWRQLEAACSDQLQPAERAKSKNRTTVSKPHNSNQCGWLLMLVQLTMKRFKFGKAPLASPYEERPVCQRNFPYLGLHLAPRLKYAQVQLPSHKAAATSNPGLDLDV